MISTSQSTRYGRHRRWVVVIGALVLAIVLGACSSRGDSPATSGSVGEPKSGGELVHLVANFASSNWQTPGATNWQQQQVINQLSESLVFLAADGSVHPWLAESWSQNPEGTALTLKLKRGVTFSDGSPLDAAIVVRNLGIIANGDEPHGRARVTAFPSKFTGAFAVDDHTVRLEYSAPDSGALKALGHHSTAILAARTLDASQAEQAKLENYIGTGPFVLESASETEVVLKRREDYNSGSSYFKHNGKAYLDRIRFKVVPEDGVRLGNLTSGQADSVYSPTASQQTDLKSRGYSLTDYGFQSSSHGWAIKRSAPFVDDIRVRKAIQHAVDRKAIIDTLFTPDWTAGASVVGARNPDFVDLSADLNHDTNLANQLLDQAGWTQRDGTGIRVKDGKKLTLAVYPTPYLTHSSQEAQLVAQQLAKVGIKLDIKTTDVTNYTAKSTDPTVAFTENTGTLVDISANWQWESSQASDRYATKGTDPQLDQLLSRLVAEQDPVKRKEIAAQYQRLVVVDQANYIPFEDDRQVYASAPYVQGVFINGPGRVIFYDTWLNK